MKPASLALLALTCSSLLACGTAHVVPARAGAAAQPRPADCPLEFLPAPPAGSYVELGELRSHVTSPPPGGALEALRSQACELGADAVIVVRNQILNEYGHGLVAGIAIKYGPEPEAKPAEKKTGAVDL